MKLKLSNKIDKYENKNNQKMKTNKIIKTWFYKYHNHMKGAVDYTML